MSVLLDIRKLRLKLKGGGFLLRDVAFQVRPGEIHGLVGEDGAGKSLLCKAVLGILPDEVRVAGGEIRFDGADLLTMHPSARRRLMGRHLAMIPQDPLIAFNPTQKLARQIAEVLREHQGLSRSEAKAGVHRLLEDVDIRDPAQVMESFPYELSGGVRQRVLIAMAFACGPKLVVADEPTAALDATMQRGLLRLISDMARRYRSAMLLATTDLSVLAELCDRATVLHRGMVVEDGPSSQILSRSARPFTRALMTSLPRYDRPGEMLEPVPDEVRRDVTSEVEAWEQGRR